MVETHILMRILLDLVVAVVQQWQQQMLVLQVIIQLQVEQAQQLLLQHLL
jgi:hypothetical protein